MNRSTATEKPAKVVAPIAIPIGPPAQHTNPLHSKHLDHRLEHKQGHTRVLEKEVRTASSQEAPGDEARVH